MLASLFACNKDKKDEPQGAKIESISFKQENYSVFEYQAEGINLRDELTIAPTAMADTCKVTWALTNTDVASISKDGVITPNKVGETLVTATVQNKSAQCKFTVKEVVVTKIILEDLEVAVGAEAALVYTTEPAMVPVDRLTLTSADVNVAKISESNAVIGVKDGETTITAKCGTVQATCNVKVGKGVIPVKSVKVLPASFADDVIVGATKKLEIEVDPVDAQYDKVIWRTSNSSVATVSEDGTVTCKGKGSCTITATVDGKEGTCQVTYTESIVHVTSVTVTPSTWTTNVTIGLTKKLAATVLPDNATEKTVTWTSSNNSVAMVSSDGTVTCKGVGTATISATCDGVSGTCTAHFTQPVIKVQSVTMSQTSANLLSVATAGGEGIGILSLDATVKPSNATYPTLTWKSSNTSVATVSNGVVTGVAAGKATITVTTEDGSYKATCTVTVNKNEEEAIVNTSFISQEAVVGEKIVFKGSATGGSGEYQYAYYYRKTSDKTWTTAGTEWGTSAYATAKPGSNTVYEVCIKVRDANNTSNVVKKYLSFAANTTETSLKCYGSVYKTIYKYGITNKITASSANASGTVKYKYEFRKASSWTYETIKDYTTSTSVSWDAPQTGSFTLRITAYDGTDYAIRTINIKVKK